MALIMAKTAEYQARLQTELEASRRRLVAYEGLVGPLEGLGAGGAGGAAPAPQVQQAPAVPSTGLGRSSSSSAGESSRVGHGSIPLAALQVTMATAAVAAATAAADLPSPQRGGYAASALTARRANVDAPLPLQLMRAVERGSRASSAAATHEHASGAGRTTPSLAATSASSSSSAARSAAAPPLRPPEQAVADAPFPQEAVDDVWAWLGPRRSPHDDDAGTVTAAEGSASHKSSSTAPPEPLTRHGAADAPLHLAQRWGPASPFPSSDPSRTEAAAAAAAAAYADDGVIVPSSDEEAMPAPPPARAASPPASQLARYRAPAPVTPLLLALRARSAAQQQYRQASPQGTTGLPSGREPQRDDTASSDVPPEHEAPSETASSLRDSLSAAQPPPPPQQPLRAPPAGSWLSLQAQQLQLPRQRWPLTAVDAPGAQADFILAPPGPAAVSQRSALAVSGGGGTGEQLSSTSARYRDSAPVVQPLGAAQNAGLMGRQVSAATLATAAAFLAAANNDGDTGGRAVVQQHPHARPLLPPDAWQAGGGNWRTALQQTQTQADPRPSRRAMSADAFGGSRSRRGGGGSGSASSDESDDDGPGGRDASQASPSGRGSLFPSAGGQSGLASRPVAAVETLGTQAALRQVDVRPMRPRQSLDEAPPPTTVVAATETIASPHAPPDAYPSAPVVTLTRVPRPTAHPSDPSGGGGARLGGAVDIPLTTSELHARLLQPPRPRGTADASLPAVPTPGGRSAGDAHFPGPTTDALPGASRPVRMRKGGGGAAYELSADLDGSAALTDAPQSLGAALPFAPQHSFSDSISTRLDGRASASLGAASTDARTKAAAAAALAAAEAAAEEASDADDASVAGRRRYEGELAAGACELADTGTVTAQQQPRYQQHEESTFPRLGSSDAETAIPVEPMPAPVSKSASNVPEMTRRASPRLEREMELETEDHNAAVDDDELVALRSRNAALEADVVAARAAFEVGEMRAEG